jgi:Fe-S-cluster-containing dehydrogenase component
MLKAAGKLIVLTAPAAAALEALSGEEPKSDPGYQMKNHWWAMTIEIDKCIGCGNCVRGCSMENDVPAGFFRTWIERYHIEGWKPGPEHDQPQVDSPNGGFDGFPEKYQPGGKAFFVPKLCNHCEHSPCVQVCPVGATFESPDGLVLVDRSYCLGCRYCIQACPYGCRFIDPRTETAEKCTLCYHRISKGLTTACCESCPTGARKLADLKNPKDPVHEFLRDNMVQVLKPHMATGSKVFYKDLDESVR